jgi:hypothetical protein
MTRALILFFCFFLVVPSAALAQFLPAQGTDPESEQEDCLPPLNCAGDSGSGDSGDGNLLEDIASGDVVEDIISEGASAASEAEETSEAGEAGEAGDAGEVSSNEGTNLTGSGRGDPGGIVPCSGLDCDSCSVVTLIERIIDWLIGVLLVIFAIITAVAGFKLVISGGNPQAKTEAKSLLTNAFIGIVIVLTAWLLVDTLMRALLSGGEGTLEGYGPWSSVQCNSQVEPAERTDFSEFNSSGINSDQEPDAVVRAINEIEGCSITGQLGSDNLITCTDVPGTPRTRPYPTCIDHAFAQGRVIYRCPAETGKYPSVCEETDTYTRDGKAIIECDAGLSRSVMPNGCVLNDDGWFTDVWHCS